ncbi:hypothetical protein FD09_GL001220 [Schleiferilactobacillus perolens DSM 12744]|uniref:Uncharacterized protein n=1 Tax=Schleiferilactobacillus perolens DSM 12744 TaxID=1423792 RepID=A0A0R1N246_9LACO|nr:hypothetical protein FD09_GL001220 [Schleiferilactobacillus perolens DSM 12744]
MSTIALCRASRSFFFAINNHYFPKIRQMASFVYIFNYNAVFTIPQCGKEYVQTQMRQSVSVSGHD